MMEDRQEKYFQFPLFMIRGLLYDPKGTLENIFHFMDIYQIALIQMVFLFQIEI